MSAQNNGHGTPPQAPDNDDEPLPNSGEEFGDELLGRLCAAQTKETTIHSIAGQPVINRTRTIVHTGRERDVRVEQNNARADCGCTIMHPDDIVHSRWGTHCKAIAKHRRDCAVCGKTFPHTKSTLVNKKDHCPGCVLWGWIKFIAVSIWNAICYLAGGMGRD